MGFPMRSGEMSTRAGKRGFTLVELLVVLAIVALLISIVTPHYIGRLAQADETVLKEDLVVMRDALDKHYADRGTYPDSLDDLVSRRYLRSVPPDPITKSGQSWVVVPPEDPKKGRVYDVHSGAPGNGSDGKPYAEW